MTVARVTFGRHRTFGPSELVGSGPTIGLSVAENDGRVMETRRARRIKRKRVRHIVASVAVVGAIGLGIGFAAPAGASSSGCNGPCGTGGHPPDFGFFVSGGGSTNRSEINVGGAGAFFSSFHSNSVSGQCFLTVPQIGRVPATDGFCLPGTGG